MNNTVEWDIDSEREQLANKSCKRKSSIYLALFLGNLGAHKFYLGYKSKENFNRKKSGI